MKVATWMALLALATAPRLASAGPQEGAGEGAPPEPPLANPDEPGAAPKTKPPILERHAVTILVRTANHPPGDEMPDELFQRHLAYIRDQVASGKAVGGPLENPVDPNWRGMMIYRDATPDAARELSEGDPAVQTGWFRIEVLEWQIEKGKLAFPAAAKKKDKKKEKKK